MVIHFQDEGCLLGEYEAVSPNKHHIGHLPPAPQWSNNLPACTEGLRVHRQISDGSLLSEDEGCQGGPSGDAKASENPRGMHWSSGNLSNCTFRFELLQPHIFPSKRSDLDSSHFEYFYNKKEVFINFFLLFDNILMLFKSHNFREW